MHILRNENLPIVIFRYPFEDAVHLKNVLEDFSLEIRAVTYVNSVRFAQHCILFHIVSDLADRQKSVCVRPVRQTKHCMVSDLSDRQNSVWC